jgi:hypothetical protein
MTTPRVEGEGRTLRQSLYQDVAKRILLNQRVLDEMDHFTPTQVDLAGRVVSLLVMRRVLDREIARRMTPRGLAAIAALIGPHVQSIEQALGSGIVRKAEALLCRGPVPASTQTRAALAQATILVG